MRDKLNLIILLPLIGAVLFIVSYISSVAIIGIIGLIIITFGIISFSFKKDYRKELINNSIFSSLLNLAEVLRVLGVKGHGIFLPTDDNDGNCPLLIPYSKTKGLNIIKPLISEKDERFLEERAIRMIATGSYLLKLFENRVKIDFSKSPLDSLGDVLQNILIEEFDLVQDINIEIISNKAYMELYNPVTLDLCSKLYKESPISIFQLGTPLYSAVGCIISKMTDRFVSIESFRVDEEKKVVETLYTLL